MPRLTPACFAHWLISHNIAHGHCSCRNAWEFACRLNQYKLYLPSCGQPSFASRSSQTTWPGGDINGGMFLRSLWRAGIHKCIFCFSTSITFPCGDRLRGWYAFQTKMFIEVIFSTARTLYGVSNAILQCQRQTNQTDRHKAVNELQGCRLREKKALIGSQPWNPGQPSFSNCPKAKGSGRCTASKAQPCAHIQENSCVTVLKLQDHRRTAKCFVLIKNAVHHHVS